MNNQSIILLLFICATTSIVVVSQSTTSFSIDYDNNQFLLDGAPFRYISGEMHYFRIVPDYWLDRLSKIKAAGLNVIQVYIPWNFHERQPGEYTFDGMANITQFFDIAQQLGLYILLRPGPYICAEWENGGLPWWLLKTKDIQMRRYDTRFTQAVDRWFTILLNKLSMYLRKNGGPILMIQLENEYGLFGVCDRTYTIWLRDMVRQIVGNDTVLYTTDPASVLGCGTIDGVYATVDFGTASNNQIDQNFAAQRRYSPKGPLVNSEFYPGWLVVWGQTNNFNIPSVTNVINTADHMYRSNASFNFYMIHGGTNFEFWNGAGETDPDLTSYDYSAPLSEAGDPMPKYMAIRNWINGLPDWPYKPTGDIPPSTRKSAYGSVELERIGTVLDLIDIISASGPIRTTYPLTFEDLDHPYGFVLYQTYLTSGGINLTADGLKDRGFVMVDGVVQGTIIHLFGSIRQRSIRIQANAGSTLSILVENRGRQNYETINDFKGITTNVTLDGRILTNWTHSTIDVEKVFGKMSEIKERISFASKVRSNADAVAFSPSIYIGQFVALFPADTFLNPVNWGKGQAYVNRFNIGRYWPIAGPQITLFTPAPVLRSFNTLVMLELMQPGNCDTNQTHCTVTFVDTPVLNVPP